MNMITEIDDFLRRKKVLQVKEISLGLLIELLDEFTKEQRRCLSPDSAQPKQEVKYPEGILSIKMDGDVYTWVEPAKTIYSYNYWVYYHIIYKNLPSEIWSVKNASGEVLTVGDVPESLNSNKTHFKYGRISGFEIREIMSGVLAIVALSDSNVAINVNRLTKAPVKKPLFVSEEDLAVFYDDIYYYVDSSLGVHEFVADNQTARDGTNCFKIKANAEAYVAENRKSVSWRELKEWCEENRFNDFQSTRVKEELLNHFSPHQKPAPGEDGETK